MRELIQKLSDMRGVSGSEYLITDEIQKRILWLRYVDRKPWRYISSAVHFTSRYVYKLHIKALEELEKILNK